MSTNNPAGRSGRAPALRAVALIVLGVGSLVAWWTWPRPAPAPTAAASAPPARLDADAFFTQALAPLIDAAEARNRAAIDRAVRSLEERFDGFRAGVRPFVEDVTSWSARLAIARRMPGDWWRKAFGAETDRGSVERFVLGRFRAHIMDERSVEIAVAEATNLLAAELEASRNLLWIEIELALRESDAPVATPAGDFGSFQRAADEHAASIASSYATDSLVSGVATFAASAAGGLVAEQAAAVILSRLGVAAGGGAISAAGAAATGTAVASGAGVGAGGGSLAGPVGAVIGFGAGLAVGAVIDWKMTDSFRDRLETDLHAYLDELEGAVLHGSAGTRGLHAALDDAVRNAAEAQKHAVLAKLTEATP